jgi:hypothetical protein
MEFSPFLLAPSDVALSLWKRLFPPDIDCKLID